jgi:lipid-binding SYLF domain-containing protein
MAVKAFSFLHSRGGQVNFGGNLSIAAGPVGRDAAADINVGDGGVAACYSYSHTRGAFAGLSLQRSILMARDSHNAVLRAQPSLIWLPSSLPACQTAAQK